MLVVVRAALVMRLLMYLLRKDTSSCYICHTPTPAVLSTMTQVGVLPICVLLLRCVLAHFKVLRHLNLANLHSRWRHGLFVVEDVSRLLLVLRVHVRVLHKWWVNSTLYSIVPT